MMNPYFILYVTLLVFLFGACIGSFLNVCIYRIPREESVVHPRSHCPACHQLIAWYDNLPVLSYIGLKGKCRHCGGRISPRYALVELLTAVLFLAVWNEYGWDARTPVFLVMVSGLLLGTFVDLEHYIIPDRVSLGGMVTGLLFSGLVPALHQESAVVPALVSSVIGLVAGAGSLYLVGELGHLMLKKEAMGLGDVKLLGGIGAYVGWAGVIFTVLVSSLLGSIIGLTLIACGKREWQGRIPYGPFLATGAVIWILGGRGWWAAYVNWITGGG
jgi:leader peptidase (prepilin peptidase)/N-methyltransferase